ncbi:hypothetical protein CAL7716_056860 [Calothrix sp. PCC 7716]|nr:hypothetical protein CAL7716_056860 [Calothrix sp. PCC 7716]
MIKSFQNLALAIALIIVGTLISPDLAQAREIKLGGINMDRYCKTTYGEDNLVGASLIGKTAWDWRCYTATAVGVDINVDDACRQQYHSLAYARAKNPDDAFSWVCLEFQDEDDQIEW